MSKRINSVQHARNTAATEKAASPLNDANVAVPGVPGVNPNAFVQAAKKAAAGKQIRKADLQAQADADADKADHKVVTEDTAHNSAPVELTVTGGARSVMMSMDGAANDQASAGSGSSNTQSDDDGGIGAAPIIIGGALVIGGVLALVGSGSGSSGGGTVVNTAPTFTSGTTASVAENIATTVVVYDGNATDAQNDAITFSLSGTDAALFSIDSDDGEVRFKASPDFEATPTKTSFSINVIATDSKGLATTQAVTVTLTNVNEAPVITSNLGGATAAVNVLENSTVVTTVTSTDVDAGATKTFSLNGGADAAKFAINATTGALTFIAAPNFEVPTDVGANNVYDVVVRVSDGTLTDDQAIAVTVTNVNEAPVITSNGGGDTAAVSVAENSTAVTTVTSTDVDAGATKTFSLNGGADAAKFAINATTGALTFIAAPNFEVPGDVGTNNVYDVIVRVSDGTLTDDQAIAVTVTDVNEAPTITSNGGGDTAAVSVAENSTAVTTVTSTDPDTGATKTFSLNGGADAAKFTINATTGALTFLAAPNFEAPTDVGANNVYDVIVRVSDGTLTDDQAIAVTVTNVNEAPTITSGATGSVNENAAVSTVVYDANATDPDSPTTFTYTLSGADAAAFTIDADDGEVRLIASANFEAKSSYAISVTATDNGSPTLSATQAVTITVNNVQDLANLPAGGVFDAGIQGVGQTDTNFLLTEDGDAPSSVIVTNFTVNDVIQMLGGDVNFIGFSRDFVDNKDLRIDYADNHVGGTLAVSTIILNDVLDLINPVFDEASAAIAMGQTGRDFFVFA